MLIRSIRWRLQVWYGVILLTILTGFGVTAFRLEQGRRLRQLDEDLRRRAQALSLAMRLSHRAPQAADPATPPHQSTPAQMPAAGNRPVENPPDEGETVREWRLPSSVLQLFEAGDTNGFYYVVWSLDRRELARSDNAPRDASAPTGSHVADTTPPRTRHSYREMLQATSRGMALVGRSLRPDWEELRRTAWRLAGAGGVILVFGLLGGWWLATRAIRPIQVMGATAWKIADGDLSQRIRLDDTESELGRLAGILNSTFARLEAAFAQQARFTSDAAHELRTPLTVVLTQIQTALARPRQAPEYQATLEACQRAAQRMRRVMESLLELARFDAGQEPVRRQPFSVSRMVRDCSQLLEPLARERNIRVQLDLPDLEYEGDMDRLAQATSNLLGNAIAYNREGGQVKVTASQQDGFLVIAVQDTGVGIAREHLPHLFERFYRVDPSRSGNQSHTGLGLAIAKAIVEAHGGNLEVASQEGVGSTFTIRLPTSATELPTSKAVKCRDDVSQRMPPTPAAHPPTPPG